MADGGHVCRRTGFFFVFAQLDTEENILTPSHVPAKDIQGVPHQQGLRVVKVKNTERGHSSSGLV